MLKNTQRLIDGSTEGEEEPQLTLLNKRVRESSDLLSRYGG